MSCVTFSGVEWWRHGFLHDDVLGAVLGGGTCLHSDGLVHLEASGNIILLV